MSTTVSKVLVVGAARGGQQGSFIDAISQNDLRSSARVPTKGGSAAIAFGRVKIETDLDLQIFAADREKAGPVADAISSGLVGAVLLMDQTDEENTEFAGIAYAELSKRRIPTVVASTSPRLTEWTVQTALGLPEGSPVMSLASIDKDGVKQTLISVFETAIGSLDSRST